jgi:ketosteroid isomerase-like protein
MLLRRRTSSERGPGMLESTNRFVVPGLGFLLLFPIGLRAQATDLGPEAEVRQAAASFVEAFNNLDWIEFAASFDAQATIFHPGAESMRRLEGRDALVASFQAIFADVPNERPGPPYLNIRPRDLMVQMLGDAAVVTFHLETGPTLNRRTVVFVRRGDRWLIAHLHASALTEPLDAGDW